MDQSRHHLLFLVTGLILVFAAVVIDPGGYAVSPGLDVALGGVGVLLGAAIALVAMLRSYATRETRSSLLLAVGFGGACILDLYGVAVSADLVTGVTPKTGLAIWNWILSGLFLSSVLCLRSGIRWREVLIRDRPRADSALRLPRVFFGAGVAVFLILTLVHTVSLPTVESNLLARPLHLLPAILLAATFVVHVRRGLWKQDEFEHLLTVAILVAALGEGLFASRIGRPFDGLHLAARAAHVISYTFVFLGIVIGTYRVIREALTRERAERASLRDISWLTG